MRTCNDRSQLLLVGTVVYSASWFSPAGSLWPYAILVQISHGSAATTNCLPYQIMLAIEDMSSPCLQLLISHHGCSKHETRQTSKSETTMPPTCWMHACVAPHQQWELVD
jgi:hypothetical protein